MRSPSAYPSAQATPALDVAIAGNPASSIRRALIASHALGRTSRPGPVCSARKRSACCACVVALIACRSEEHTSELQSRGHLVCRLLLEKTEDVVVGAFQQGPHPAMD